MPNGIVAQRERSVLGFDLRADLLNVRRRTEGKHIRRAIENRRRFDIDFEPGLCAVIGAHDAAHFKRIVEFKFQIVKSGS